MTIWMLQSKKKFVAGIFMGIIGVLILTSAIGNMIDKPAPEVNTQQPQPFIIQSTVEQTQTFVDTNGYTPEWAKDIGENQASLKCSNIMLNGNEDDFENNWCMEYLGYLLDKQN